MTLLPDDVRLLNAATFDAKHPGARVNDADYGFPGWVGWFTEKSWLRFDDVDLGNGGDIEFNVVLSRWREGPIEGGLEVWLGGTNDEDQYHRDGTLIGTFEVPNTDAKMSLQTFSLEGVPAGVHDVYFYFPQGHASYESFRLHGPGLDP